MPNTSYIISFDLDDTLYDNRPVIVRAFRELYAHLVDSYRGFDAIFDRHRFVQLAHEIRKTNPEVFDFSKLRKMHIESALNEASISDGDIDAAYRVFLEARQKVELFAETLPTLRSLKQEYQLISISNGNAAPERIGLGSFFSASFNPTNCGYAKPDPNMYLEVCHRLNITPNQIIHIGDCIDNDYHAAIAAGCQAIWFKNTNRVSDVEPQINNLTELTTKIRGMI